jgi:hypothetical protein
MFRREATSSRPNCSTALLRISCPTLPVFTGAIFSQIVFAPVNLTALTNRTEALPHAVPKSTLGTNLCRITLQAFLYGDVRACFDDPGALRAWPLIAESRRGDLMGIRSVVLGAGLISMSIAFVGETRDTPDTVAEKGTTPIAEAPLGDQQSDDFHPDDMPQRLLSLPIRCEQWIAQWGPGEIPRQRCVNADLRYRSASR